MACYFLSFHESLSKEELKSINPFYGGEWKRKNALDRIAANTHNFQNEEWRKKDVERRKSIGFYDKIAKIGYESLISSGRSLLRDSSILREEAMNCIANGNHQSQVQHTCPYCNTIGFGNTMFRHHFENCKLNPNYRSKPKTKIKIFHTCPHCNFTGSGPSMVRFHFDKCKQALNSKRDSIPLYECPHCNKKGSGSAMKRHHFDNCKLLSQKSSTSQSSPVSTLDAQGTELYDSP